MKTKLLLYIFIFIFAFPSVDSSYLSRGSDHYPVKVWVDGDVELLKDVYREMRHWEYQLFDAFDLWSYLDGIHWGTTDRKDRVFITRSDSAGKIFTFARNKSEADLIFSTKESYFERGSACWRPDWFTTGIACPAFVSNSPTIVLVVQKDRLPNDVEEFELGASWWNKLIKDYVFSSLLVHEIGHAVFGLPHNSESQSIMNFHNGHEGLAFPYLMEKDLSLARSYLRSIGVTVRPQQVPSPRYDTIVFY